jgi:UDP-glucose 4-epimerase
MSGNHVLLLGGSGFIGTALAAQLAAAGRKVHVLSRSLVGAVQVDGITYHAGGMDAGLLSTLLPDCSHVVHLAASTTPGSSARAVGMEAGILSSTLHFLDALQQHPHVHLTFLSSGGTVYGNPSRIPVNEDAAPAPLSYHGAGKAAAEVFLHAFRESGNRVAILRPANTYGPGQRLNQGFGVIRTVLQHALDDTPVELWGDGENVRDFVYLDDVVGAILLAMQARDNGTYNVGSGEGHTLNQIVAAAERVCGARLAVVRRPARKTDVRAVVLDCTRIRTVLGWQPQVNLETGLAHTWNWLKRA